MESSAKNPVERSPDGKLIDQLVKSGSDPGRLHQFEFTLRLPTQKAAERVELELMGFAFTTRIEPGRTAEERVIRAGKTMYPLEPNLQGLRDKLEAIAATGKGSYEGWTAKVKPGQ